MAGRFRFAARSKRGLGYAAAAAGNTTFSHIAFRTGDSTRRQSAGMVRRGLPRLRARRLASRRANRRWRGPDRGHAKTNLAAQFARLSAAQRTALAANNTQDPIRGLREWRRGCELYHNKSGPNSHRDHPGFSAAERLRLGIAARREAQKLKRSRTPGHRNESLQVRKGGDERPRNALT